MSWDSDFRLVGVVQKLVETRLRIERVRLAQRIQALETQVVENGGTATDLRGLRTALIPVVQPTQDQVDAALVHPRKPDGVWRKRYLSVQAKPGSIF